MADEENPLGGGPFGVGPFGPLIAAAAVAASAIYVPVQGPDVVFRKTLQYQSIAYCPPPPAAVAYAAASTTTSAARTRTLFYQSTIRPIAAPAAVNTRTEWDWHKPLNTIPPRYVPAKVLAQPFVPREAVLDNTVTPDKWLIKWQGPPNYNPASAGGSPFIPKEAVLENTATPDKWLVRFAKAVPTPRPVPTQPVFGYPYESQAVVVPYEQWWHQPLSRPAVRPAVHNRPYQPFVPREAVLENTQTPDKWLPSWQGPPRQSARLSGGQFFAYKAEVVANLTTTLEWLQAWQGAKPTKPVHTQPTYAAYEPPIAGTGTPAVSVQGSQVLFKRTLQYQTTAWCPQPIGVVDNNVTGSGFYSQFHKVPPKTRPPLSAAELRQFAVPVRPDGVEWLQPFGRAVARADAVQTQPSFVYQPVAVSNLTTTIEWLRAWPIPPRYQPAKIVAQPFVPRAAVLENTISPDKWLFRFAKAVPRPKPVPTQPFFGYPYEVQATPAFSSASISSAYLGKKTLFYQSLTQRYYPPEVVPNSITGSGFHMPLAGAPDKRWPPLSAYENRQFAVPGARRGIEWLQRWPGPPRALQRLAAGAVYAPIAPTVANLTTTLEWLQRWQGPPRYQPPKIAAQPFVPKQAVLENTVTPDKWLFRFAKAVPAPKPRPTQPFFGYPYLAADNTVTPDKWLVRWQGPPRYRPIKVQTPPFVPKEAVLENTQTPDKWLFRFQKAVPHGWPTHTQPFFGYPYVDLYFIGGPADEPERVVCVLASSRVAVVPELDRVATPLPSDTLVASNEFEDMPCPPFGNDDGIPEDA